jgi:hypothetical protein
VSGAERRLKADTPLKQVLGRDEVSIGELTTLLNQNVTAARQ